MARVDSVLRRAALRQEKELYLTHKDLKLDLNAKLLYWNDIEIGLTAKEYAIMELFMQNKAKVFAKANLFESIWGEDCASDDRAIKTHISNLRSKLKAANPEEEYIETVWGLGYRLYKE